MRRDRKTHRSDEFGKAENALAQLAPHPHPYGGPTAITLDAIAERESGKTPPPPPFGIGVVVIGLIVALVVGIAMLLALQHFGLLQFAPVATVM